MLEGLNGATRVYPIVGDPIAQVKSPAGVTRGFAERGVNAVCIPLHVAPAAFAQFAEGVAQMLNVDGLIMTVPHKFAGYGICASATDRARCARRSQRAAPQSRRHMARRYAGRPGVRSGAAQRRRPARSRPRPSGWRRGRRQRHRLGAHRSGVRELVIYDSDPARVEALVHRISGRGAAVRAGPADPAEFDMVCNATPSGMREDDPVPVLTERLRPSMVVGDVITVPEVTPLLHAALAAGCRVATGTAMFRLVQPLIIDFLLGLV